MGNIYFKKNMSKQDKLGPKEETVNFLLNYSKALNIVTYGKLEFETLLNYQKKLFERAVFFVQNNM